MTSLHRIVLPESDDDRVLEAARYCIDHELCHPVMVGEESVVSAALSDVSDEHYSVIAPVPTPEMVEHYRHLVGSKFIDEQALTEALTQPLWFGAALVACGEADGIVAGSVATTGDVLRAYGRLIGLREGVQKASSCFLLRRDEEVFIFTDCGVVIQPTSTELAMSARLCADFAKSMGLPARTAFLSFSSHGSAEHPQVDVVREAVALTKQQWPELVVDGELQLDAAIVPAVAARKTPGSPLGGEATILVFPDLQSGNIGYKLAERLGGFTATGPLLLGFKKPAHDLSRGCTSDDIVAAIEIAVTQAAS